MNDLFETITNEDYFEENVRKTCTHKSEDLVKDLNLDWQSYKCLHTDNMGKVCFDKICPKMKE